MNREGRRRGVRSALAGVLAFVAAPHARAQEGTSEPPAIFNLHFQETTVTQVHPSFPAPYTGPNSLSGDSEWATSITSTLFGGMRLWTGAELYVNPEISGGAGLSEAAGVAGAFNGETFRVGSATPVIYPARIYLRQTFDLGGCVENVADGPNQLRGTRSTHRLTLIAGKFGVADFFDNNAYSHDPRTQFLNWSLMNSGAWDYPADTRGYTYGVSVEYTRDAWSVRGAAVMVPKEANGLAMDTNIGKAHGLMIEGEWRYAVHDRAGTTRLLLYWNQAHMGNYDEALALPIRPPDIAATRRDGRNKFGFTVSAQQELTDSLGSFARLSADDGQNETWAFTEIDRSIALGIVQHGAPWHRDADEIGLAVVGNAIVEPHQRYLAAGGLGFILGDGALDYGLELLTELYYRFALTREVAFTPDYQFVLHPGYNEARGPVHVFSLRAHIEF